METMDAGVSGHDAQAGGGSGGAVVIIDEPEEDAGPPSPPKPAELILEELRLDPPTAVLELAIPGSGASLDFRLMAKFEGVADEQDITEFGVFSVSDNYELGEFSDFKNTFQTNATDPRGGTAIIKASASGTDGVSLSAEGTLEVKLTATLKDPRDHTSTPEYEVPANATAIFDAATAAGAGAAPPVAPEIVYPNPGTLFPPNLGRFEVQFTPGSTENTLFEIVFEGPASTVSYQLRCGELIGGPGADPPSAGPPGCLFELDANGYRYLAESSRGQAVNIRIAATDDAGAYLLPGKAESVEFALTDVNGGLYYWTTTHDREAIMRFEFGSAQVDPEVFIDRNDTAGGACVGCHALSRDGTKMVASLNGQGGGQQVLVTDLSKPKADPDFFTKNGDAVNRLQFASFNPTGSRFVGVYGDTDDAALQNTLWFYDGDTGERQPNESVLLPWEPDHPDWSPDGKMIALTRVGIHGTSQRPYNCGIELIQADASGWTAPETVIPIAPGKSRYNPSFIPDSSLFVYSESTCPLGSDKSKECDADADPSATTWAVAPNPAATPVWLNRAGSPGARDVDPPKIEDKIGDTFARVSPFNGSYSGGRIVWVTVSSGRELGLRTRLKGRGQAAQQLWMFAVDPDKVLAGVDGSFPAFFLPFQDLKTANHIAQWTTKIVTDKPPPEPPPAKPPPNPPPPPPAKPPALR